MDRSIVLILEDLQRKLEKSNFNSNKKSKYASEISFLKDEYANLEVSGERKEVYDSLLKKGRELLKESNNMKDSKKVDYYLRYCHAALYDFKENLKPLNHIVRAYLITCALFLVLSPQYLKSMVPLMLLIPIYLGLKGMKSRSLSGFMYGMSAMPMALLTSVIIFRNTYLASKDFTGYITSLAQEYGKSPEFARNLILGTLALAVVMLASALYTILLGVKHRKMFI